MVRTTRNMPGYTNHFLAYDHPSVGFFVKETFNKLIYLAVDGIVLTEH